MVLKVFGNKRVVLLTLIAIAVAGLVAVAIFILDVTTNGFEVSKTKEAAAYALVACMAAVIALPLVVYGARRQSRIDR